MTLMNTKLGLATAVLTIVTASAHASPYVFGSLGSSNYDLGPVPAGFSVDDDDTTASILIGYQFSDNFSIEGGYVDLGETSISTTSPITGTAYGSTVAVDGNLGIDATGLVLGLRVGGSVNDQLAIFGRAGIYDWKSDVSVAGTLTIDGTSYAGSASTKLDDGTDVYLGLGAEYSLTDNVALSIDWTQYALEVLADDLDVDTFNLGIKVKF